MEQHPKKGGGQAPWGFWGEAAQHKGEKSGDALKNWFVRHRSRCSAPELNDRWDGAVRPT